MLFRSANSPLDSKSMPLPVLMPGSGLGCAEAEGRPAWLPFFLPLFLAGVPPSGGWMVSSPGAAARSGFSSPPPWSSAASVPRIEVRPLGSLVSRLASLFRRTGGPDTEEMI